MSLKAKLEAVIYAAEEPVTLAQLAMIFADDALAWQADRLLVGTGPDGKLFEVRGLGRESATLARVDPRMPMLNIMTLDEHLGFAMYQARVLAGGVASLGAAGLGLSLIGLYAVISFMVARRRREIGVRMALGAEPRDVVMDVMRQTAILAGVGMLAGLLLAGAAGSAIASALVGVSPFDPATYLVATVVVAIACLIAVWQPSRKAARVDPAVTLRE